MYSKALKVLPVAVLAAAGYLASAPAVAVTMTFEGVAAPGSRTIPVTPYSEAGFTLTNSPGGSTDGIFDSAFGVNSNGTDIFGWCAACGPLTITLAKTGGGAFTFNSFDTAALQLGFGTNFIDVIGHLSGGGTLVTTIEQLETWTHQVLNYADVTSVDFAFGVEHLVLPDHAFDNLTMNAAAPEPGSIALLGLGLAGLWAGSRRKA